MSIGHATATASASALKRRRQAAGFYMFHSQLKQFYVTQLQDIPFPSLPFGSPSLTSSSAAYRLRIKFDEGKEDAIYYFYE